MKCSAKFLESYAEFSPEREYFEVLCKIISGISFSQKDIVTGLGLLYFLEGHDFVALGVDTTIHWGAGSRRADALFVADVFRQSGYDALWWKFENITRAGEDAIVQQGEWWLKQFQESDLVDQVL